MRTGRPAVIALDALALALLALAFVIAQAGGFVIDVAGLAVSFRTPSRTLLWMLIAIAARVAIDRHTPPFGIVTGIRRHGGAGDALDEPPAPGRARRALAASAALALVVALILRQQVAQPFAAPDLGDPLFSIWRIAWVLHQLAAAPSRLFDANIFHAEPLTLTFSDPTLVSALLSAPMLAAGLHPVAAYTALMFGAFWLSGVTTYLLVERLTRSALAAFIAGAMYATSSFRFDHYSHLELQMTFWMPAGLLALHLFVRTARWRYAAALAAAGVLQLYSSMYYAVFFLIYVAAAGGVLLILRRPPRGLWKPAAACALAAALLAAPLARPFLAAHAQKGERSTEEVTYYSARPRDFARANRYSAVWRGALLPPEPERALFPGAAPLALGAVGLLPPIGPLQIVYAAGLLVSLDGALGFYGATYPLLYRSSGIVRGLRAPARFIALISLTLAILSGFGVARILRRCRGRAVRACVAAALTGLVVADAWPDLTLGPVWRQPPAIYAALEARPDAVLAEFPVEENEVYNLPYMYFSAWHHRPMVNGYSGFIPSSYRDLLPKLLAFPGGESIDALRRRGVTHVTVNCVFEYTGCPGIRARVAASRELRLVAESEWEGQPVRLYEITPR